MKKAVLFQVLLVAVIGFLCIFFVNIGNAEATPKYIDAIPTCDADGNVTIPLLPGGASLLNAYIYDDVRGTAPKPLGPVTHYKLEPGQGTNFFYKDAEGSWFQMITRHSVAPGFTTDCSWIGPTGPECKYVYTGTTGR